MSLAGFQGEDLAFEDTGREVAHWAQQYFAGGLSFEQFFDLGAEETEDEDVAELLDLIEHEPQHGGILGARPADHDRHMGRIQELIRLWLKNHNQSPAVS